MPSGVEDVIKEFERVKYSYPFSSYSSSMPLGVYPNWTTFDPETLEVVEEDPVASTVSSRSFSTGLSSSHFLLQQVEKSSLNPVSVPSQGKVGDNNPCGGIPRVESPSGINNIKSCSRKSCCEIKIPCSHYKSSASININNLNSPTSTQPSPHSQLPSIYNSSSCKNSSAVGEIPDNNNIREDCISSSTSHKQQFELLKQFESVTEACSQSKPGGVGNQLFFKGHYNNPSSPSTSEKSESGCSNHQFCESSLGGTFTDAPGLFHHLTSASSWKDQQHLTNCNRPSGSTNCNQINMSSSVSCGVSSSSIFGGLCSGNTRRPSMFTAKYRMREERKKVLKMSLGKVKRIEDPESFLRRSVLINNTIKRLQKEVRDEKMMRHGGSYTSKLSSCSSYRKSFACSRLNEMHLSVVDEPDTGTNSLLDHDDDPPHSRSSPLDNLVISKDHHNSPSLINSRKRQLNLDDSEEDCDVQAVLSQIYIPPTPCSILSSIDDDDNANDAHHHSNASASSSTSTNTPVSDPSSQSCSVSAAKKSRLSPVVVDDEDTSSLLTAVTQQCSLDDDVDVDVDVVGDSEMSDWPTPPPVTPTSHLSCSSNSPSMTSSLSLSSVTLGSSLPIYTSSGSSSCNMLNTSPYATGLGRVMTVMSDSAIDFPMVMDLPPITRDSDSNPSASLNVSATTLVNIPTTLSPSLQCNGSMSPLPLQQCPLSSTLSNSLPTSSSSEDSNSSSDEEMNLSSETKENTCSLPLSLPLSGLHSPLADRNSKCTSDSNGGSNNNNNNHTNANSISNNNNANIINNNNNSMINSQMSETDKGQQQYSSCGHSSIFGELQSVVFHSLIASLES